MRTQAKAMAILLLAATWSATAAAQSHPQEVLDLIAQHEALAAKVRPLVKRVSDPDFAPEDTGFRPEGAPLRATVTTSNSGSGSATRSEPEQRVPERLGHRDRAAASSDDAARIATRLSALETQARTERERIMRPNFGGGTNARAIATARSRLAALQRELAAIENEINALDRRR